MFAVADRVHRNIGMAPLYLTQPFWYDFARTFGNDITAFAERYETLVMTYIASNNPTREQSKEYKNDWMTHRRQVERHYSDTIHYGEAIEYIPPTREQRVHIHRPEPQELKAFTSDRQNVHTNIVSDHIKSTVEKIKNIHVPHEYRRNRDTMSKTPGEIIMICNLPTNAATQMVNMYSEVETYGELLDAVWQYTLQSEHKDDICKSIRIELTDNIDKCPHGNIARLCNILAGYMEGVSSPISPSERLGIELPKLMELEDVKERIQKAEVLLRELKVPETEWNTWTEPLMG